MVRNMTKNVHKCLKRTVTKGPQEVHTVIQIVDSETSAVPYIKEYTISSKLVDMHFKGHQHWFDLSVYIARKIAT